MNSSYYGCCQARVRVYFVLFHRDGCQETDQQLRQRITRIWDTVESFEMSPPAIEDVILPKDHPYVVKELQQNNKT